MSPNYNLRSNTLYALTGGFVIGILGLARTFLVAHTLPPDDLGEWSLLQLILVYTGFCHLGVAVAMPNEIVAREALDDRNGSKELAHSGLTLILGTGILVAAACLILPREIIGGTLAKYRVLFALTFLAQQSFLYIAALLRGLMRFQLIALGQVVFGAGSILMMAYLLPIMGVRGALVAMFAGNLTAACVGGGVIQRYGYKVVPLASLKFLFVAGFPLLISALIGTGLQNIDRVLVGRLLGKQSLGYYSVSNVFIMPVMFLPSVLGGLLMTHFSRAAVMESDGMVKDHLLRFSWAVAIVLAIVTACIYMASGGIIRQFIPKYQSSLLTVRILLVGSYFYASTLVLANFLIANKRQIGLLWVQGASLTILGGLCLLAIMAGASYEGVGWANLVTYFIYFLMLAVYAKHAMGWDLSFAGRMMASFLVPFGYMAGSYYLCRPLEQKWASGSIFHWSFFLHLALLAGSGLPMALAAVRHARRPSPV